MAIRLIEEYPNRVGAPTADYPHGVPRNKSTPTATDGTPFEQSWFRDQEGFFQGLMETAGITPSGAPDTVLNSDYLDALNRVTNGVIEVDMGGAADVSLSAYQGRVAALKLTGALAADVDLIVPDTERMYWIIDETTGDFSVTVKTAAGTGVKLFGESSAVRSDGTNVVPFVNGMDRRVIYVGSVSELKKLDLEVGQNVRTLGYYTPGDGGGNDYEVVAAGTGTDDGGSYIDLAGSGLQARGLFCETANIDQFGATEGGEAAPYIDAAIQAYINYSNFSNLTCSSKSYILSQSISADENVSGLTIDFSKGFFDLTQLPTATSGMDDNATAFIFEGGSAVTGSPASDLLEGSYQLSVTDSSVFSENDILLLRSDDYYADGATATNSPRRGELIFVKEILDSTTIEFHTPVYFTYLQSSNFVIEKLSPIKDFQFIGGEYEMGGAGSGHRFMNITNSMRATIKSCIVKGPENAAFNLATCIFSEVNGCHVEYATSPSNTGSLDYTTGYGVVVGSASRGCSVVGNTLRYCRHGVSGGGKYSTGAVIVSHNKVDGSIGSALECHEDCYDWLFEKNYVNATRSSAINARGQRCSIIGNVIRGSSGGPQAAITVSPLGTENPSEGYQNAIVSDNSVITSGSPCIAVRGSDLNTVYRVIVSGNSCERRGGSGSAVYIEYVSGCIVDGNSLTNWDDSRCLAATNSESLQILNNSISTKSGYVSIHTSVEFSNCSNINFSNAIFGKNTNIAFLSCESIFLGKSIFDNFSGDSDFMICALIQDCTNVLVDGLGGRHKEGSTSVSSNLVRLSGTVRDVTVVNCYGTFGRLIRSLNVAGDDIDFVIVTSCNARNSTGEGDSIDLPGVVNTILANNFN